MKAGNLSGYQSYDDPYLFHGVTMLTALLRLFALRPIRAGSLVGIPILTLIMLGLATALFLKLLLFVVLPITLGLWLLRKVRRAGRNDEETPKVQTL